MKRALVIAGILALALFVRKTYAAAPQPTPLRKTCADPWLLRYDGKFYLTQTGATKILVEESETLEGPGATTCQKTLADDNASTRLLLNSAIKASAGRGVRKFTITRTPISPVMRVGICFSLYGIFNRKAKIMI